MGKGFKYYYDDEKIRAYMKVPPEQKLKWLEEVLLFNNLVLDKKTKEIREKLRRAEV